MRISPPRMRVAVTDQVGLPLPLIVYDVPWASVPPARAAAVADTLDGFGMTVAALRCELGETNGSQSVADAHSNRICPYRPDRYGLTVDDLTTAKIIDLRLASCRDPNGQFSYSAERMRRWDLRLAKAPSDVHTHTAIPIRHWPPDVGTTSKLTSKIAQLRLLAPSAAICVSLDAGSLEAGVPILLRSEADLLAIRADDWSPAYAAQLAGLVAVTRHWLDANARKMIRLVIVPPPSITADDIVKLLALGADLVAVDGWCSLKTNRSPSAAADDWAAATLGVSTRTATDPISEVETALLEANLTRIATLVESTGVSSVGELNPQHLITFDPAIPGVRRAAL